MNSFELAALFAATMWAISGLVSAGPSRKLGAIRFSHLRMWMVFAMLMVWVAVTGQWRVLSSETLIIILVSGFVGIFLGDTALFATLNRMGPRRTGILYSLNAPISVLLGWLVLDEALSLPVLGGIFLTLFGVVLAIIYGKRASHRHHWEEVKGPLLVGIMFGVVAAAMQSAGSLIIRPVMAAGIDPAFVSALRVGVAAVTLSALIAITQRKVANNEPVTGSTLSFIALSGFLAMGLGMTALLYALSGGEVGIMATLSATTPVLVLPMLWLVTREMPAPGAWVGALLVVAGTALIFVN